MRKALRISATALTVASLSPIATMPLAAGWRTPAQQVTVAAAINPFRLMERATDLPVQRVFEIDPSTCELFRATDMPAQRRKLLQMLPVAVRGLDNLDALASTVEELGRRHAGYGVTDAHYDSVGAALLWTLQQGLGEAWTPAVAAAWTAAYGFLSGIMRRAAVRTHSARTVRVASVPDQAAGPL